jgi:AraC-like DNA-binding protein
MDKLLEITKPFYEAYRDTENLFVATRRNDFSFNTHFHSCMEILFLVEGEYRLTINAQSVHVKAPAVILMDCFDIHSYEMLSPQSDGILLLIPQKYLSDHLNQKGNAYLNGNVITDPSVCKDIQELIRLLRKNVDDEYLLTAYIHTIIRTFTNTIGLSLSPSKIKNQDLIQSILVYVKAHFKDDITLHSIAEHFSYSESHLSRLFHSYFPYSISFYINSLRIEYVNKEKNSSNIKMLDLIYEAGFQSPQAYYRNLKAYNEIFNDKKE